MRRVRSDTEFRDFEAFLAYVGPRPSAKHRLHRPNPSKPFGPGNCEWTVTPNRGRLIEFDGLRLTAAEWAARLGITKQALSLRLAKYPLAVALSPGRLKRGPRQTRK